MSFKQAVRTQKKLRMALHGPSGSGKTYSALQISKGLGTKIALIDTERGSASLYADRVQFDVIELEYFSVDNYISGIGDAVEAGYDVLIIDSLSHAWTGLGGVLDAVNNTKGNTFTEGWGKVGTPQHNRLLDAILKAPLHIIVTLRVKTDYEVEKDERGKSVPKKVGMQPVQRDGIEYEFDIVGSLDSQNHMTIEKSRMIDIAGKQFEKPDEKFGKQVLAWLSTAKAPAPRINPDDVPAFRKILVEEATRLAGWAAKGNADLLADRAAIIECYVAVKGVATSIDLREAIANNPATPSMSAIQIRDAARAVADACDAALPKVQTA
jgi:hypothetical protein